MEQIFWIAVKTLIKNPEGKFLILFKSNTEDMNPHDFDIPWGRVKRGEKLEDALIREAMEECGLSITIEKVSRTWGFTKRDLHLVGITYLAHCDTEHIKLSDEHTDYFWQSKEDILSGSFPDWLKEEFLSL